MREFDIHQIYAVLRRRFGTRRMALFETRMQPSAGSTVLDVGGTPNLWRETSLDCAVTLLNLRAPDEDEVGLTFVKGDATSLPFASKSFDIVFSNSVIEHLGNWESQRLAAEEAMRVGRRVWIQTPNRWFFVEPHFLTPFIHWLPRRFRRATARNFTVWGLLTRPTREYAEDMVDEIRLLSESDLRELFPECQIIRERFLGSTKSLIATS